MNSIVSEQVSPAKQLATSARVVSRSRRLQIFTRIGLTVFLLFHLSAILISPNSQTYLGRRTAPVLEPYVSFLELTNNWSFFAPDPGPPPVFIDWELLDAQGEMLKSGSFPERRNPFVLRERQNRRIAAVEFMLMADDRIQKMLVPYLCRSVPGTHSVKLWRKMNSIPGLSDVADGKRTLHDDEGMEKRWVGRVYCEEWR